jgi:CspA family cold shock protein
MHGTIRWFDPGKAYGFIAPEDGGDDLFVRLTEEERRALGALRAGDPVTFRVVEGRRGPEARYLLAGHVPAEDII